MAGKFGSASVWCLVDGYNLISNKLKGLRYKIEALRERSDGLGDAWEEHTPTGLSRAELAQEGAFWDTTQFRIHAAMANSLPTTPQASVRIACLGMAGHTAGESFVGFQGAYTATYDVLGTVGGLTKANVQYAITGQADHGIVIQPLAAFTQDLVSASVDNGAATTGGGIGYLQIVAPGSFGAFTGRLEHSADNSAWEVLLTFSAGSAPSAQRQTVTGTVKRYLRFGGVVWGDLSASSSISQSPSVSPSVSASASASPSLSPSVSASASASPSLSPSTSLSPSASTSLSPSSSLSPSLSASSSLSRSLSPSSSISPSVSASASASPSSETGIQGSVTVFCGFVRS